MGWGAWLIGGWPHTKPQAGGQSVGLGVWSRPKHVRNLSLTNRPQLVSTAGKPMGRSPRQKPISAKPYSTSAQLRSVVLIPAGGRVACRVGVAVAVRRKGSTPSPVGAGNESMETNSNHRHASRLCWEYLGIRAKTESDPGTLYTTRSKKLLGAPGATRGSWHRY